MKRVPFVYAAALLLISATPSSAQNGITLRGFADAGLTVFSATQSFSPIFSLWSFAFPSTVTENTLVRTQ